jgi:hypothetical protein
MDKLDCSLYSTPSKAQRVTSAHDAEGVSCCFNWLSYGNSSFVLMMTYDQIMLKKLLVILVLQRWRSSPCSKEPVITVEVVWQITAEFITKGKKEWGQFRRSRASEKNRWSRLREQTTPLFHVTLLATPFSVSCLNSHEFLIMLFVPYLALLCSIIVVDGHIFLFVWILLVSL